MQVRCKSTSLCGHRPARAQLTRLRVCLIVCGLWSIAVSDALMIMVSSGGLVLSLVQAASVRIDAIEPVVYKLEGPALLGRCSKEEK